MLQAKEVQHAQGGNLPEKLLKCRLEKAEGGIQETQDWGPLLFGHSYVVQPIFKLQIDEASSKGILQDYARPHWDKDEEGGIPHPPHNADRKEMLGTCKDHVH